MCSNPLVAGLLELFYRTRSRWCFWNVSIRFNIVGIVDWHANYHLVVMLVSRMSWMSSIGTGTGFSWFSWFSWFSRFSKFSRFSRFSGVSCYPHPRSCPLSPSLLRPIHRCDISVETRRNLRMVSPDTHVQFSAIHIFMRCCNRCHANKNDSVRGPPRDITVIWRVNIVKPKRQTNVSGDEEETSKGQEKVPIHGSVQKYRRNIGRRHERSCARNGGNGKEYAQKQR